MRAARRAHAGIMPGVGIRQGLIPTPSAIIPTSGALYHRLPPPLTGGARAGQMAWRRWSGIEGPHVQPPPRYAAYPMAACQVSYARPSLCLAPLHITPLPTSPLPLPISTRAGRRDWVGRRRWREGREASACRHHVQASAYVRSSFPTPSAIIPTSGALSHHPPPPLTGGAARGQMAWRGWSGIEGPHVQPPPRYAAYPMAAC